MQDTASRRPISSATAKVADDAMAAKLFSARGSLFYLAHGLHVYNY